MGGTGHYRACRSRVLTSCRAQYLLTRDVMPQATCDHISPLGLRSFTMDVAVESLTAAPNTDEASWMPTPLFVLEKARFVPKGLGKPPVTRPPLIAVAMTSVISKSVPSSNPNFGRLPQSRRPSAAGRSSRDSAPAARGALAGLPFQRGLATEKMEAVQRPASKREAPREGIEK